MRFRPCIDLHNGKVKQIVGSSLSDTDPARLVTNFESELPPSHFARIYRKDCIGGGHVIMLGPGNESAAVDAVRAYPGGLQVGGGINPSNAAPFLNAGATHVIVTSYVFREGLVDWARLEELRECVGKDRLVVDLSCKRTGDGYVVVTDRWQRSTDVEITGEGLARFAEYCSEFLVHAADVEGKQSGIEVELVKLLGEHSPLPVTYAGGIRSIADLDLVRVSGEGRVDATVGSALDIFGGSLPYRDVVAWHRRVNTAAM